MQVEFNDKEKEIITSVESGFSYSDIAKHYGITNKYVHILVCADHYKESL